MAWEAKCTKYQATIAIWLTGNLPVNQGFFFYKSCHDFALLFYGKFEVSLEYSSESYTFPDYIKAREKTYDKPSQKIAWYENNRIRKEFSSRRFPKATAASSMRIITKRQRWQKYSEFHVGKKINYVDNIQSQIIGEKKTRVRRQRWVKIHEETKRRNEKKRGDEGSDEMKESEGNSDWGNSANLSMRFVRKK